jgi:hypothetical protein
MNLAYEKGEKMDKIACSYSLSVKEQRSSSPFLACMHYREPEVSDICPWTTLVLQAYSEALRGRWVFARHSRPIQSVSYVRKQKD